VWQPLGWLVQLLLGEAVAAASRQEGCVEPAVEQPCAATQHLHAIQIKFNDMV
jgi:hypothetical protein